MFPAKQGDHDQDVYVTEYGIPIHNIWYMLLYAWNEIDFIKQERYQGAEEAPSLDSLLTKILIKLIKQRLRIGLGRNYRDDEDFVRGIKGRVLFSESIKRNSFSQGKAYCKYQAFSIDVPKNQIIFSTISQLIHSGEFGNKIALDNELRHDLRWIYRAMEGVTKIELSGAFINRQQLGRNDRDYRLMINICELLLFRDIPLEADETKKLPSLDKENLTMFRIFEKFVANFLCFHLKDWHVSPQSYIYWAEDFSHPHLPKMQPDILLTHRETKKVIVIDTKFTQHLAQTRFGNEIFHPSHLYQMYAYLKTQEWKSEEYRNAVGILLYPSTDRGHKTEEIPFQGLTIRVATIDLTNKWQDIENQLAAIAN